MLPKNVYSKILQSLRTMKQAWDQDRIDHPNQVPYEIDHSLKSAIERHVREGRVQHIGGRTGMETIVNETIEYLTLKGLIIKSPYGGHMFQPPTGTTLPTKDELIAQTKKTIDKFFGKPKDFTSE